MAENEHTRLNPVLHPESRRSPFKEISTGCKETNFFGGGSAVPANLTFEGLARGNKENSPPVQFLQPLQGKKDSSVIVQTDSEPPPAMPGRIKSKYVVFYILVIY